MAVLADTGATVVVTLNELRLLGQGSKPADLLALFITQLNAAQAKVGGAAGARTRTARPAAKSGALLGWQRHGNGTAPGGPR